MYERNSRLHLNKNIDYISKLYLFNIKNFLKYEIFSEFSQLEKLDKNLFFSLFSLVLVT